VQLVSVCANNALGQQIQITICVCIRGVCFIIWQSELDIICTCRKTHMMKTRRGKETERVGVYLFLYLFVERRRRQRAFECTHTLEKIYMVEGTPTKIMRMKSLLSNFITIAAARSVLERNEKISPCCFQDHLIKCVSLKKCSLGHAERRSAYILCDLVYDTHHFAFVFIYMRKAYLCMVGLLTCLHTFWSG